MDLVFDIETNGFVKDMTTIHCIVTQDLSNSNVSSYHGDKIVDGIKKLESANAIIGHNIIGFDIPAINKLYEFNPKGKILDTLVYVRKLWPDIRVSDLNNPNIPESLKGRHSLDAWGHRLGENKGTYDKGWDIFTDEMLKYCVQDVKVTSILWKLISSKL